MSSIFSTWRRRSFSIASYTSGSVRSSALMWALLLTFSVRPLRRSTRALQLPDLLPPSRMPAALDLRVEIRVHDALRELGPDHPLAEREQVHVDVLDRVARGPLVGHDRRAHARDLVRRDARADARAAHEDRAIDVAARDGLRERRDDERVIVVRTRGAAERDDAVTFRAQVLADRALQALSGVVGGDADLHAAASVSRISLAVIAPSRRTLTSSVVQSTTVDATPPVVGPPSRTSEMRPSSCATTSSAVCASGAPERLALVTGKPPPLAAMSRRATGGSGTRNASVPRR